MTELILLKTTVHRQMGWRPPADFRFASQYNMAPVGLPELAAAIAVYSLAYYRSATSASVQLVALTGFRPGQNLFVSPEGRWTAPYIPQSMLRYPFALQVGRGAAVSVGLIPGLDVLRAAPDSAKGEHRFFNDQGDATAALTQMVQGLQADLKGQQLALRAMLALEAHGLLEPWPGAVAKGDLQQAEEPGVGLFRTSEAKLNALNASALKELQQANALPLAYAQLLSMGRLQILQRLAAQRERVAAQPPAPDSSDIPKQLFDLGESDTIRFNW